jgi:phage baseplate assembly protein W
MPEIPHFAFPFRFISAGGRTWAAETEQGSADELFDCVHAIIRTQPGTRIENPDFGVDHQEFHMGDVNLQQLQAEVLEWEPRANVVFSSRIDEIDELIQVIGADIHAGKTTSGMENEV